MHIVFFVTRFWPAVGGVEKYVRELGKALVEMGHRVTVVAGAHQSSLLERETLEGIEVFRYPAHRSRIRCWYHLMRMRRLFIDADVVHISDVLGVEYYHAMIGWTMPRRSIYLTRHGLSYQFPVPSSEKRRAARAAALVDGIIDDGAFIAKWLGVPGDVSLEQGLSPTAEWIESASRQAEPPPNSAVFVGRLEGDTGIELYIDAIALLRRKHRLNMSLDVFGGGSLKARIRARVRRERLPVRLHGFVENAQERISDACFAFVAGRLAMQEAMARRRLVIAACANKLRLDYVCQEPFSPHLVAAGSAAEVADHVAFYTRHPNERVRLTDRAFEHARTLTWQRTARGYLNLWCTKRSAAAGRSGWLERATLAMQLADELG